MHFARDCRAKGNQDSRRRNVGYNENKTRDNGRRPAYQDDSKALVTIDGEDIDWSGHVEKDSQNYPMIASFSSNSGSNNEIRFMKIELDDKTDVLTYHKKLLAEAIKEKEDLKTKFENWQHSSKNLSRLLNTQMSAKDKFGLRYGDYKHGGILSYENEVLQRVFMNKASDLEDTSVNDRYADGMHAVPLPMTGIYMPSRPDVEIDYSKFTYGPKQTLVDELDSQSSEYASCKSDSSVETTTSMPAPVENAPKVVCEPKVWIDAPIIEEYESDSDNDYASNVQEEKRNLVLLSLILDMTGNKAHLADYQEFKGGSVAFGGRNGRITSKGKIKKGKKHKASCKAKIVSSVNQPLQILNMDLLRPTSVRRIDHKTYCLVIIDDFIRTSQQNGVAKRKNRTLIEAARTMLADSFLATTLWAEAVNNACYVLNRKILIFMKNILYCLYGLLSKISRYKMEKTNDFKTCEKPVSQVEQIFLEELEKFKRQEKEVHDAAESLRKEATNDIQNVNTSSTNLRNTVSTPLSTAGPSRALNDGEPLYPNYPSMPHLGDIYASPSEGIFTDSSYDDEGVFQIQKVWILVDLPYEKKAIGTKWVYRNKKDERGVVVRNKERLVAQGHRQEEGIDYDKVFTHVARIEAIRIFLAFASYMGFIVYQMDVKSAFLYGTINEEKSWCDEFKELIKNRFQMSSMGELTFFLGLQVQQKEDGIFISQDKYVDEILTNFDFVSVKTANTPIETQKPLVKDEEAIDVDVHLYRFQVTPKTSHLQVVKRIFRYLKGQPKLGLWYPKVSSFDQEAYSNSDHVGDQPPFTESSSDHDSSQDPRVDLEGIGRSGGDQVHLPHDSPLSSGHTSDRAKGSLNLEALYALCTNLPNRVLALETVKDAQTKEILKLKAKIKKVERRCKPSISHHQSWLRSVSLLSKKKKLRKRKSISKQGRKTAKSGATKDGSDKLDAELDEDMNYMDTKQPLNKGRQSTVSTTRLDDDTARPDVSTVRQELSTAGPTTTPTTSTIFDDKEITLADTLIKLKDDKAKGVAFKESKSTDRPTRSILTLKPLLTIDPKDKEKVQARIDDDHELAVRCTHEEQEKYIVDERAKLLAEYYKRRKKQLAEERAVAIRNKPPTKTQLRRLMMTYLKNMGRFTHSQLNKKSFEEIQGIYIKEQELIADFVPIGSKEDERMIKDLNKKAKEESSDKGVDSTKKRKEGSRMKRMSNRQKTEVDLEEEEKLKTFLKIDPDEEGVIDYEVLDKRFPIINWESKFYHYDKHGAEGIYYRIFRSDGSSRWIKTFLRRRFNSLGDLRTMFEANAEDELWQNQEKWSLKSWNFYENCGVHILILEDGPKIHILAERRYPLTTRTLERMLSLRLIVESASDDAYDLLRFIQKQIDESGGHDRGEKDL
nr:hypothetical protein [Tanacetum cinerariifolium]